MARADNISLSSLAPFTITHRSFWPALVVLFQRCILSIPILFCSPCFAVFTHSPHVRAPSAFEDDLRYSASL
jgi:hypothetical protein